MRAVKVTWAVRTFWHESHSGRLHGKTMGGAHLATVLELKKHLDSCMALGVEAKERSRIISCGQRRERGMEGRGPRPIIKLSCLPTANLCSLSRCAPRPSTTCPPTYSSSAN